MTSTCPQNIAQDLVDRANAIIDNWPPKELEIKRLRHDARKLKNACVHQYEMILGMCATMSGDLNGMREFFESAQRKSGGDLDVLENYARSLAIWHFNDEASSYLLSYLNRYQDSLSFSATLLSKLVDAGRFHEAAKQFDRVHLLGAAAAECIEEFQHIPKLSEVLADSADEEVSELVSYFGEYLRGIGALNTPVEFNIFDAEEIEEDFGGVEIKYFVREEPDRAALLDFEGSRFLAERQFPIELCGKVTLSICSWIVETDAHQAA